MTELHTVFLKAAGDMDNGYIVKPLMLVTEVTEVFSTSCDFNSVQG